MEITLTPTPLYNAACAETYHDVEKMLFKLSHEYAARYYVPFEEVISEARIHFMKAYHWYHTRHKSKAKFSSFAYFIVANQLTTYFRNQYRHRTVEYHETMQDTEETVLPYPFRAELDSELTADARDVVRLILDTPEELRAVMKWRRVRTQHGFLQGLQEHLKDLGWDYYRIQETFEELREILKS